MFAITSADTGQIRCFEMKKDHHFDGLLMI